MTNWSANITTGFISGASRITPIRPGRLSTANKALCGKNDLQLSSLHSIRFPWRTWMTSARLTFSLQWSRPAS